MHIWKVAIGIAIFLLNASSTSALEVPCANCSQASSAIAAKNAGLGTHYVYDIPGGIARKYTVEREPNEMAGYDYFVFPDDVEQDFVDAVSALSAVWHETTGKCRNLCKSKRMETSLGLQHGTPSCLVPGNSRC